jgi:hypothetical protein
LKTKIIHLPLFTILLLVSTILFAPLNRVNGDTWGVEPTDYYSFTLSSVTVSYTVGSYVDYNENQITFGDAGFLSEGDTANMTVNSTTQDNLTYELSHDDLLEEHVYYNGTVENQFKELMLLPLLFAQQDLNWSKINRGYTGLDYLVVPNGNYTWDIFDSFDNMIYLMLMEGFFEEPSSADLQAKTNLDYTQDTCIYDWLVNGTYIDSEENTDLDVLYWLKSAYEISTGVLFGMRTDCTITGTYDGMALDAYIESEVLREGYTLGDFILPTDEADFSELISGLIPGFGYLTAIISLIVIIPTIRRKRK